MSTDCAKIERHITTMTGPKDMTWNKKRVPHNINDLKPIRLSGERLRRTKEIKKIAVNSVLGVNIPNLYLVSA